MVCFHTGRLSDLAALRVKLNRPNVGAFSRQSSWLFDLLRDDVGVIAPLPLNQNRTVFVFLDGIVLVSHTGFTSPRDLIGVMIIFNGQVGCNRMVVEANPNFWASLPAPTEAQLEHHMLQDKGSMETQFLFQNQTFVLHKLWHEIIP
jgi:hypothetical protein